MQKVLPSAVYITLLRDVVQRLYITLPTYRRNKVSLFAIALQLHICGKYKGANKRPTYIFSYSKYNHYLVENINKMNWPAHKYA